MAKVGETLSAPEDGWKRYNDTDQNITYGEGFICYQDSNAYGGTFHGAGTSKNTIRFNFTKTKLTLIALYASTSNQLACVRIDGVKYPYQCYGPTLVYQKVAFTVENLSDSEHWVEISCPDDNGGYNLDAIDIDENGELKP